jgi:hypothetical protein
MFPIGAGVYDRAPRTHESEPGAEASICLRKTLPVEK